jgi:hypothetical protein
MAQQPANPDERKKQILAAALGLLALIAVGYTLFGGGSPAPKTSTSKSSVVVANSNTQSESFAPIPDPRELNDPTLDPNFQFFPIAFSPVQPASGAAARNIFAFPAPPPYKPPPTPKPVYVPPTPTPTPTPPPPLYLGSVSPGSVFARTGEFTLTVAGDKFTPESRIYFGERELPTRFVSPQQLIATVPGDMINTPGARNVAIRTPDGVLYSNPFSITINEPPKPDNYTYVGLIGTRFRNDTAILKDKNKAAQPGNDLETYQRGDVVGGRFKILSISEREVVLVDTALKLSHRLAMQRDTKGGQSGGFQGGFPSQPRYPQPPSKSDDDDDDDP